MTTPIETDLFLFGRALPLSPAARRVVCRVCGLALPATDGARLCDECSREPERTRAHCEGMLRGARAAIDACTQQEFQRVAALDDAVADRWEVAYHSWQAARAARDRARTQRWPEHIDAETRAQAVRDAQARLDAVEAKIDRTIAKGGALSEPFAAWRAHLLELERLRADAARWEIALNEIEVLTGEVPF